MSPLILIFAACAARVTPPLTASPQTASPQTARVVVAHTNDLHTHFAPNRAPWLDGAPDIGGFAALGAHLADLRSRDPDLLYLDGGDVLTGTPLMEFEVHGARGGAMLDFLQAAGCDAWVVGNHEFDMGWENAAAMVAASPVPVLSANLDSPTQAGSPAMPALRDHVVLESGGLQIGVFGLTTKGLPHLASAATLAHIDLRDPIETARAEVATLEPQVDLIVALTHIGVDADRALARAVPEIDLIVGGHSHTALKQPVREGTTWIVQAGSYTRQLGLMELTVRDGAITAATGRLIDLRPEDLPAAVPEELAALEARWTAAVAERFTMQVGMLTGDLLRKGRGESAMGRFAADVVRAAAEADLGLYNRGGLRADIAGGSVTVGDLYQVFPFDNEVVRFEVTGAQLAQLASKTARSWDEDSGFGLLWSGLRVEWGSDEPTTLKPEDITVAGAPVTADARLTLATNSYIAEQWKYFLGFEPEVTRQGQTVRAAAVARFEAGPVEPPADPRFSDPW